MAAKEVKFGSDARNKMLEGVDIDRHVVTTRNIRKRIASCDGHCSRGANSV